MIILTINPKTDSQRHSFDKNQVIIGSENSKQADLTLSNEEIQDIHVKIWFEEGKFFVSNLAHDPFATLNGMPFGKKPLKTGDILNICLVDILFEGIYDEENIEDANDLGLFLDTKEQLEPILNEALSLNNFGGDGTESTNEEKIAQHKESKLTYTETEHAKYEESLNHPQGEDNTIDFDTFFENIKIEDENFDFEALMREIENMEYDDIDTKKMISEELKFLSPKQQLEEEEKQHSIIDINDDSFDIKNSLAAEEELSTLLQSTDASIKQQEIKTSIDAITTFSSSSQVNKHSNVKAGTTESQENEDSSWTLNEKQRTAERNINWKLVITLLSIFMAAALFLIIFLYFAASGKSGSEEIKATRALADISMALSYAQVNHIKPQKNNWTDPEFLNNNLTAVLADRYAPIGTVDATGQLSNSQYHLRIYTSGDFSHFLIIAQPAPSITQWLFPKSALIVDSKSMEMRRLDDLKPLNRLLVNPMPLEETNAQDLTNIIKEGELIAINKLAEKNGKNGFIVPKALALIRPGAEHKIYNAPRYYPFGEGILKKALQMIEQTASSKEVDMLRQEVEAFDKFPDLVLYSPHSINYALKAQKALSMFVSKMKFLFAYLKFGNDSSIINAHLIINEDYSLTQSEVGNAQSSSHINKKFQDPAKQDYEEQVAISETLSSASSETHHPLYLHMASLEQARNQSLKPIADEIIVLINRQTQSYQNNFYIELSALVEKYQQADIEQQNKIYKALAELYQDYNSLPLLEVMAYVKSTGLEDLLVEKLQQESAVSQAMQLSFEEFSLALDDIDRSQSLSALETSVNSAANMLTLTKLPDPEKIIHYQKILKSHLQKKLDQLLTHPEKSLSEEEFNDKNRSLLQQIIKKGWIIDRDVIDYYLNEFDQSVPMNIRN